MTTLLKRPLYSVIIAFFSPILFSSCSEAGNARVVSSRDTTLPAKTTEILYKPAPIDSASYKVLLDHITNGDSSGRWPANNSLPPEGAILPFNRIIAYYGNLYSKNMGILGEFPKDSMIGRLRQEVRKMAGCRHHGKGYSGFTLHCRNCSAKSRSGQYLPVKNAVSTN